MMVHSIINWDEGQRHSTATIVVRIVCCFSRSHGEGPKLPARRESIIILGLKLPLLVRTEPKR